MTDLNPSRRSVLKSISTGTAILGTTGLVAGKPNNGKGRGPAKGNNRKRQRRTKEISAEEAGVADKVNKELTQGNIQKAKNILRKNGVKHTFASAPLFSNENNDDDNAFQTQDAMSKSDSYHTLGVHHKRDDNEGDPIYEPYCVATIHLDEWNVVDDANPKDAISITWSDSYFQPVSQSSSNVDSFSLRTADDGDNVPLDLEEYQDYKKDGVWIKVKDNQFQDNQPPWENEWFQVGFLTEIEKLQYDNEYNINTEYLHNWNLGGAYYVNTFNLGPAGINFGGYLTDSWRKEVTEKA